MYHHSNSGIRKPQNKSKNRDILSRYGIIENPRNLRLIFTLCMQEFFDSIPQNQWKINDPAFIKQSEEFATINLKYYIHKKVTLFDSVIFCFNSKCSKSSFCSLYKTNQLIIVYHN